MNPEDRLAGIVSALEAVGLTYLVMGGHAVRFYGLLRNTIDFDLHLAPDKWDDLPELLSRAGLVAGVAAEGPSWRPRAFRRFEIGRLPDGRQEWLEFWRSNHLLPPFVELHERRESGQYGGRVLDFLSLPDLIRSKETERASDWRDIEVLEEFLDARLLAGVQYNSLTLFEALAQIRSRTGLESFLQAGHLANQEAVAQALPLASHSVTQALLLPFSPTAPLTLLNPPIEAIVVNRLQSVTPASALHLTLVEAVRRQYRSHKQALDRLDKQAQLTARDEPAG